MLSPPRIIHQKMHFDIFRFEFSIYLLCGRRLEQILADGKYLDHKGLGKVGRHMPQLLRIPCNDHKVKTIRCQFFAELKPKPLVAPVTRAYFPRLSLFAAITGNYASTAEKIMPPGQINCTTNQPFHFQF